MAHNSMPSTGLTAGWFVLYADNGVAVLSGCGGTIDVTPGFVIPELGQATDSRTIQER
jgi:hypothetical protein